MFLSKLTETDIPLKEKFWNTPNADSMAFWWLRDVEQGYPVTTAFFEGRQFYAGTSHRPLNIWGSRIDDYENMDTGNKLDDASMVCREDS